jgi:RNA polymerase sigma factor (sigma-70 family)
VRSKPRIQVPRCTPRAQSGAACWEEIIVRQNARLRSRVRRTLQRAGVQPRADQVEELTQEVYCRLLDEGARRLAACRGDSEHQIAAYLGRAAERVVFDQLRAARALKRGRGCVCEPPAGDDAELVLDPAGTPEDRLLARERRQQLLARCGALVGLRYGRRGARVLELALLGGCTGAEIAGALGEATPRGVERMLRELRRRLRRRNGRI